MNIKCGKVVVVDAVSSEPVSDGNFLINPDLQENIVIWQGMCTGRLRITACCQLVKGSFPKPQNREIKLHIREHLRSIRELLIADPR